MVPAVVLLLIGLVLLVADRVWVRWEIRSLRQRLDALTEQQQRTEELVVTMLTDGTGSEAVRQALSSMLEQRRLERKSSRG
jgi:hypothetical protein